MSSSESERARRRAEYLVEQLIAATGVRPADRVLVLGSRHIELLLAFARRGFDRASCCAAGAPQPDAPVALVVLPDLRSEAELCRVLRGAGRVLFCRAPLRGLS